MEDTLQDALKAEPSLLPQRKAVEWLHYVIQNDGACDLVLAPLRVIQQGLLYSLVQDEVGVMQVGGGII